LIKTRIERKKKTTLVAVSEEKRLELNTVHAGRSLARAEKKGERGLLNEAARVSSGKPEDGAARLDCGTRKKKILAAQKGKENTGRKKGGVE